MTMTVRRLPQIMPQCDGLPVLDISDEQQSIGNLPGLMAWWRADALYDPNVARSWSDRQFDRILSPGVTGFPTLSTPAGLNGKSALKFGTTLATNTGEMINATDNLVPIDEDYTIVAVSMAVTPGNFAPIWGNGLGSGVGTYAQVTNSEAFQYKAGNGGSVLSIALGVDVTRNKPLLSIVSNHVVSTTPTRKINMRARLNKGAASNFIIASPLNGNTNLQVGLVGARGASGFGNLGDYIAELLVFNTALLEAGSESIVAALESYLGSRYGL